MLDILTENHLERRQRIVIAAITIALAAQIHISTITDGFILTLSLFILPVFLYFNDDVNPFHICLGIAAVSPIFRGLILALVGKSASLKILEFVFTDVVFYLCYGFCFYFLYWNRSYRNKGTFFLAIIICDYLSNILEISLLLNFKNYTVSIFQILFLTALVRALVSCALAYTYSYLTLLLLKDYHEQRYYYFIWSTSAVKSEVYFMQKNILEIENIMKNAYLLDKELAKHHLPQEYQHLSLDIARDVHEIKKDYQNVIKGLGTYFSVENESSMTVKDIFRIALSYIRSLIQAHQQDIIITEHIQSKTTITNYYFLLTIVSNIVLNAVEAIGEQKNGTIIVSTQENDQNLSITISDNGPGISDKMKKFIFQSGFSTKFDANGDIYRGIGLSNVKVIVEEQFKGNITCSDNQPKGAIFTINLSMKQLVNGVSE
ncbi:ATP-binding protein [Streptococcus porcinus]|uniref:Two-component sensor histidine kinase,controling glutamine utilization n=2 Tax=Streptococcus porcinus TaxID=1340 RepID=A0A4V0HDE6_STRPO|nr:ATP-binding protein [Streptococcus porcinus]EGJ26850.1 ATPase/histidine kinase/DNA gyrase B/HSP90 domain protein [Streptococcus porcinus str. Jelinkova 176]SQG48517.1 Two-component sensor histidine kinase,controling glutamine utilization [Streptococcus porcinus]VTT46735.1 Two-component sensor histidine kinase,controling glutamine utilization [Streptococcus porcinus]VTT47757.1 Two-component sensor histidine kinase,controling glutamine utilization [Streptococcus porcinus]